MQAARSVCCLIATVVLSLCCYCTVKEYASRLQKSTADGWGRVPTARSWVVHAVTKYNKVGKVTHTAEIESDAHDVHHHEKEAFHFRQFVPSSFRNPIPIRLLSGFGFSRTSKNYRTVSTLNWSICIGSWINQVISYFASRKTSNKPDGVGDWWKTDSSFLNFDSASLVSPLYEERVVFVRRWVFRWRCGDVDVIFFSWAWKCLIFHHRCNYSKEFRYRMHDLRNKIQMLRVRTCRGLRMSSSRPTHDRLKQEVNYYQSILKSIF